MVSSAFSRLNVVLCTSYIIATSNSHATPIPLFQAYMGYPPCYRQPVFIAADNTHLIAFAEGRNNSYCSGTDDGDNSSIVVRSSADGGQTWSTQQELYHGHPDYLSAIHDSVKGRSHLFLMNSPNLWTYSDDFGLTWSPLTSPTVHIPKGYTATPGVAHGIQLRGDLCMEPTCGGTVNRLLVAWVCHGPPPPGQDEASVNKMLRAYVRASVVVGGDVACPGCYSCLAYSDDAGTSWTINPTGISVQEGSREASIAQLASSSFNNNAKAVVYASERNLGNVTGFRLHAVSLDAGETFATFGTDPGIPDSKVTNWTGIVAGVTRFDDSQTQRIVLCTPSSKVARADMTLYTSTDETSTWSAGTLYQAGPAGYSDTMAINSTHGGILFENGAVEFAQQISFGYFTTADL